jgi:hypothetical protein
MRGPAINTTISRTMMPELNWMNTSLQTAMSLLRNADLLSALPAVRKEKGVTR